MPNEVINRVHHMARQEKANHSLVFQNRNQDLLPDLEDNDNDESYVPSMSDSEAEYELPDPVDDGGVVEFLRLTAFNSSSSMCQ